MEKLNMDGLIRVASVDVNCPECSQVTPHDIYIDKDGNEYGKCRECGNYYVTDYEDLI